ncbi:MAG: hypothetical protein ACM3NQ_09790 [Bacteroidales bacterium]
MPDAVRRPGHGIRALRLDWAAVGQAAPVGPIVDPTQSRCRCSSASTPARSLPARVILKVRVPHGMLAPLCCLPRSAISTRLFIPVL